MEPCCQLATRAFSSPCIFAALVSVGGTAGADAATTILIATAIARHFYYLCCGHSHWAPLLSIAAAMVGLLHLKEIGIAAVPPPLVLGARGRPAASGPHHQQLAIAASPSAAGSCACRVAAAETGGYSVGGATARATRRGSLGAPHDTSTVMTSSHSLAAWRDELALLTPDAGTQTDEDYSVLLEAQIDRRCADNIRLLVVDSVNNAKTGHPGLPMGLAEVGYVLWKDAMKYNPKNPGWFNRDRFVLSAGHGCLLQYICLHLAGYDLQVSQLVPCTRLRM